MFCLNSRTETGSPLRWTSRRESLSWTFTTLSELSRKNCFTHLWQCLLADVVTPPRMIVPANEASWEDLQAVFGRGHPSRCQCQRFKIRGREWDADSVPVEERVNQLREQTRCGHPEARTTSGLVAYLDGEPVGWCAVEPRTAYVRLGRVPWAGRAEEPTTASGPRPASPPAQGFAAAGSAVRSRAPPSTSGANAEPVRSTSRRAKLE